MTKEKKDDQTVTVRYNRRVWAEFRKLVREKFDLEGAIAVKKLIDHAMRTGEIPGIEPRFDYAQGIGQAEGAKTTSPQHTATKSGPRRPGFNNSRSRHLITSGDLIIRTAQVRQDESAKSEHTENAI